MGIQQVRGLRKESYWHKVEEYAHPPNFIRHFICFIDRVLGLLQHHLFPLFHPQKEPITSPHHFPSGHPRTCSSSSPINSAKTSLPPTNMSQYPNDVRVCFKRIILASEVQMSWKKPKLSKGQKLVSKVNMDGVDHDVARLNTNGKKRASNGSTIDS
ncbi:hypothetical protein L1987_05751 [Smallanthus sonchifolius]|uniref:Uncharacterized protein n=1 Tax=Smallanthus sonchifolius TaxID=185202 RepID=A0ACB9JWE2_9ASTR|nr:hypothetical protein L1987_05751 [Smallanthus sonchifolius]